MKTPFLLAAIILLGSANTAHALEPSVEFDFCLARTAVVGTVIGAHSDDCRLHSGGPMCLALVDVTVRVDEVLNPSKQDTLRAGDVVHAVTLGEDRHSVPMDGGVAALAELDHGQFIFTVSRTGEGFPVLGAPFFTPWPGRQRADAQRERSRGWCREARAP